MTLRTVKQSGGNYSTLAAALAACNAGDVVSIEGSWTVDDTSVCVVNDDNVTIQIGDGAAAHPGYWDTSQNHYRLVTASNGSHAINVTGSGVIIDGLAIKQNSTGNSDEAIRIANDGTNTIKNCLITSGKGASSQDGIYSYHAYHPTVHIQNCIIWGFTRGGIGYQHYSPAPSTTLTDWFIGSCSIYDCQSGIQVFATSQTTNRSIEINVHNTWSMGCSAADMIQSDDSGGSTRVSQSFVTFDVSYSIDSDGSIGSTGVTGNSGNLTNRALTDSSSPGTGDWVVVEDKTTSPYDFRLKSNAENDAQDRHAVNTAEGVTILSTDILGLTRPSNTNHDVGAFEIQASATGYNAIHFNPTNNTYISGGSATAIDDKVASPFTAEGYFRTHGSATSQTQIRLISKGYIGTAGWSMYIDGTNDRLGVEIKTSTTNYVVFYNNAGVTDGDWHHIAFFNSIDDKIRLLVDGVRLVIGTTIVGTITSDASYNLLIGTNPGGSSPQWIDMAWIRLSNTVRYGSATNTVPGRDNPPSSDANTLLLWKVDEGSGTSLADSSSNSNTGTIYNGVWFDPDLDVEDLGTAVGIQSTPYLGKPSLTHVHALSADGLQVSSTLGTPVFQEYHALSADGIQVTPELGTAELTPASALSATGLQVDSELGTPELGQTHALHADSIQVTPELGRPALTPIHALQADGLEVDGVLGTSSIGQTHMLSPVGIEVQPVLAKTTIGIGHLLEARGLVSTPTVGTPTIGQTHILVGADGLQVSSTLGTPELGQIHALAADGLEVGSELGQTVLTQIHALVASGVQVQPVLGSPTLTEGMIEGILDLTVRAWRPVTTVTAHRLNISKLFNKLKVQARTYREE